MMVEPLGVTLGGISHPSIAHWKSHDDLVFFLNLF